MFTRLYNFYNKTWNPGNDVNADGATNNGPSEEVDTPGGGEDADNDADIDLDFTKKKKKKKKPFSTDDLEAALSEVKDDNFGDGANQEDELIDDNFDLDFNKLKKKKKSKKKDLDEIMAEVEDKAEDKENGKKLFDN